MTDLEVKITFIEPCLGTSPNNPDIHAEFIASKAPDAMTRQEEIENFGVDEYREKSMTIFQRTQDGDLCLLDYQIKGFFKEACGALQRMKGEDCAKESLKLKAYKKIIDTTVEVYPRRIPIKLNGEVGDLQRPLRASTAQGERIALADSEMVNDGSSFMIRIEAPNIYEPAIREWLTYGKRHGIGQWRNASYGRFTWKEVKKAE